jgi:putative hydrolase of the HAD superfamily
VFDLDNTLYSPGARLFDQINARIADFVMGSLSLDRASADRLRHDYWHRHGTTLEGLMIHHDTDPDAYLAHVHDISIDHLEPDTALRDAIAALPGRKIVHTNGSAKHAARVLDARGLRDAFDAVYGLEHADYRSKPDQAAFVAIHGRDGTDPADAVMIEDDPRNLEVPHRLGMATVHVAAAPDPRPHIHHYTADLTGLLRQVLHGRDQDGETAHPVLPEGRKTGT